MDDSDSLISIRLSVNGKLLRLSPAWAVVAGGSIMGLPSGGGIVQLFIAIFLADCIWGLLWEPVMGKQGKATDGNRDKISSRFPYVWPNAPAVKVVNWLRGIGSVYGDRHTFSVSLVMAIVVSAALGPWATFLTLIVLLVVVLGAGLSRRPWQGKGLVSSIFVIGLPWLLGDGLSHSSAVVFSRTHLYSLTLALSFTLLHWGIERYRLEHGWHVSGIIAGELLMCSALIIWWRPSALAIVAGLLLPPTCWMIKACHGTIDRGSVLSNSAFWWWAVLAVVIIASLWGK